MQQPSLWVDKALRTIGAWGGDNGYAGKGCVGGEENAGAHLYAKGVLSANVMNEELTEGCTLGKQGRKPTCVPVILADIGTPLAYRCRAHIEYEGR